MKGQVPSETASGRNRVERSQPTAVYALGTRLSGTIVSFGSSILILLLLSPERIGIFLTVASLAAFSNIADLGLNYSFLLAASSRPEKDAAGLLVAALTALVPAVIATGATLFIAGSIFFSNVGLPADVWLWPWASHCIFVSLCQVFVLAVTFVEGTGRRDAAWRANFWLEVVAGGAMLSTIALRHELWAFAASSMVRIVLIAILFRNLFHLPDLRTGFGSIGKLFLLWLAELWPMQWKNLINNLVGLLTTRLLTPLLLAAQGAATAGRVGLALSLTISIVGITSAWPTSQTALYTALYHQGRLAELIATFRSTCLRSLLLSIGLCLGVGLACEALRHGSVHMAARLPETGVLWLILAAAVVAHLSYSFAILLRTRRTDPVVFANLLFTVPALAAYWVGAHMGPLAFAVIFFATGSFFAALYAWYVRPLVEATRKFE
jgi:hypothetical protein